MLTSCSHSHISQCSQATKHQKKPRVLPAAKNTTPRRFSSFLVTWEFFQCHLSPFHFLPCLCLPLRLVTPKNTTLPIAIVNAGRTSHQHTEATHVQVSHRLKNASVGTPPSRHRHKKSPPRDHQNTGSSPQSHTCLTSVSPTPVFTTKASIPTLQLRGREKARDEVGTLLLNLRRDVRVQSSLSVGIQQTTVRRPHPGTPPSPPDGPLLLFSLQGQQRNISLRKTWSS